MHADTYSGAHSATYGRVALQNVDDDRPDKVHLRRREDEEARHLHAQLEDLFAAAGKGGGGH